MSKKPSEETALERMKWPGSQWRYPGLTAQSRVQDRGPWHRPGACQNGATSDV